MKPGSSKREVQPLGLFFWGERWLLAAWCERRDDYRCFRLDSCLNIVQTEGGLARVRTARWRIFCAR
jgi:predicted DNA-binding transcriptional regulator YafY